MLVCFYPCPKGQGNSRAGQFMLESIFLYEESVLKIVFSVNVAVFRLMKDRVCRCFAFVWWHGVGRMCGGALGLFYSSENNFLSSGTEPREGIKPFITANLYKVRSIFINSI